MPTVHNITSGYVSVLGVPLYDGHGVLHPEVDGGGGGLVVVVLGGAALVLPAVLQAGQSQSQLRHSVNIILVDLGETEVNIMGM